MYREHLQRWLDHLKRALRIDQRLTHYELRQLAQAIIDCGRMIQAYENWSGPPPPWVIVHIPELAHRFRETTLTIQDALQLLEVRGGATRVSSKIWKVKVIGTLHRIEDVGAA